MPKKEILQLYSLHAGKIFSNLSIVFCVLSVLSLLSPFLIAIYYLMLIFIVIITFGLIFVWVPNFGSYFISSDTATLIITEFFKLSPIFVGICIGLAALAIALLILSRKKSVGRIVFSSVTLGIALTVVIILVLGVI